MQHTTHNKPVEFAVFHRNPVVELDSEVLGQHATLSEALQGVVSEWQSRRSGQKSAQAPQSPWNHPVFQVET